MIFKYLCHFFICRLLTHAAWKALRGFPLRIPDSWTVIDGISLNQSQLSDDNALVLFGVYMYVPIAIDFPTMWWLTRFRTRSNHANYTLCFLYSICRYERASLDPKFKLILCSSSSLIVDSNVQDLNIINQCSCSDSLFEMHIGRRDFGIRRKLIFCSLPLVQF